MSAGFRAVQWNAAKLVYDGVLDAPKGEVTTVQPTGHGVSTGSATG